MTDSCETCRFWRVFTVSSGHCRRRAPACDFSWAETRKSDWCGEHEPQPVLLGPETLEKIRTVDPAAYVRLMGENLNQSNALSASEARAYARLMTAE